MFKTRGDLLRHDLAMALARAVRIVRGLRKALTWQERDLVADETVKRLAAQRDDPWKLNEDLPSGEVMSDLGAPTPDGWCKPKP